MCVCARACVLGQDEEVVEGEKESRKRDQQEQSQEVLVTQEEKTVWRTWRGQRKLSRAELGGTRKPEGSGVWLALAHESDCWCLFLTHTRSLKSAM